ncbi:MAG: PQQ-binding-like beta-propeller repeat protein [Candidatus Micrarchaeaceae archaeon]
MKKAQTLFILSFILFIGAIALFNKVSSLFNLNIQSKSVATSQVLQYDGSTSHTYYVNYTINSLDLNLTQAIFATPTVYKGYLLVTTMGNETDLINSRYDRTYGELAKISLSNRKVAWIDKFPDQIMSQPITVGNVIIVAMGNNLEVPPQYFNTKFGIFGIDFNTGRVLWNISTNVTNMPTPGYYKGIVIEPDEGYVYAINATTGRILYILPTNVPDTLSSPLIVNGTAYFGACYANVYGFNSTNFKQKNVSTNCWFLALNITGGNFLWAKRFLYAGGGINDVSPSYWNGIVITGYLFESDYEDPVMVGLDSKTGEILWQFNTTNINNVSYPNIPRCVDFYYNQNSISPITVANGTAYFDSNYAGVLVAVNATNGREKWATFTGGQTESNPNIIENGKYLVIANDYGDMLTINATNGKVINAFCTGIPHLENEVVVTKNRVIYAGMDGRIITYPIGELLNGSS